MLRNQLNDCDIHFLPRHILTKEMLGEMYACTKDFISIYYDSFPDGILTGLDVIKKPDGYVWLTAGLLKFRHRIYRMAEAFNLSDFIAKQGLNKSQSYALIFYPEEEAVAQNVPDRKEAILAYTLRPVAVPDEQPEACNGFLFARFKLRNGSNEVIKVELDGEDSDELIRKLPRNGFWNMSLFCYSGHSGNTFHPWIFRYIFNVIESKKENKRILLDYMILQAIANQGYVEKTLMDLYIQDNKEAYREKYKTNQPNLKELNGDAKIYLEVLLKTIVATAPKAVVFTSHSETPISRPKPSDGSMI